MKKSLISAVKKLLAKLGAEEIEGNNLVEVIDSGADAIAEAGGGNIETVVITKLETGGRIGVPEWSCNKTYQEVYDLVNANSPVLAYMVFEDGESAGIGNIQHGYMLQANSLNLSSEVVRFNFEEHYATTATLYALSIDLPLNGTPYNFKKQKYTLTPANQ